jgi:hypothetical protein
MQVIDLSTNADLNAEITVFDAFPSHYRCRVGLAGPRAYIWSVCWAFPSCRGQLRFRRGQLEIPRR